MFTKLKQCSWIKIEVARIYSTQECFQGLHEACGDAELPMCTMAWWVKAFLEGVAAFWTTSILDNLHTGRPLAPLAMGNSGTSTVLIRYESMRLRSLHQSERSTTRDPVQHKRWTYPCYRAVNLEHQQRWTRLPNIWQKVIHKGATILKVHKCCTPVNEAMSEISNCCHYFLSSPS